MLDPSGILSGMSDVSSANRVLDTAASGLKLSVSPTRCCARKTTCYSAEHWHKIWGQIATARLDAESLEVLMQFKARYEYA